MEIIFGFHKILLHSRNDIKLHHHESSSNAYEVFVYSQKGDGTKLVGE